MAECFFFFSSRRRHTRWPRDWSSDVCSSDLVDWAARDAGGPDLLSPLVSGPLAELFLKLSDQCLPVGHTVGVGRVALVLGQLGTVYGFAQVGKLGVVADGHNEGFVRSIKGLVWNDGGVS